jgi:cytochrome c peroxidase
MFKSLRVVSGGLLLSLAGCGVEGDINEPIEEERSALSAAGNDYGTAETFTASGTIDFTNPFFQALGTNPRTCGTCHSPDGGWTITADANKELFKNTDGLAPLFNLVDQGSRPDADISTKQARKETFELSIKRAVTRFTRNVSAPTFEFTVAPEDPSGFSTTAAVLNFRRPTASANQTKVSSILNTSGPVQDIPVTDAGLMNGAAGLHEQRDVVNNPVPTDVRNAGRDLMLSIFFAQIKDNGAGRLDAGGALGGPANLSMVPFTLGMNDPATAAFNRKVFNIFDAWEVFAVNGRHNDCAGDAKAAIYRGQEVFNFNEFTISGVPGFNDVVGIGDPVVGTCSTCHNTPNVGGHSVIRMMDIGSADEPNCYEGLPILAVTNKANPALTRRICDMGRGGNGVWADLAKFRVPPLRGLAARAPYFHDGQAKNIKQAIKYHEDRFNIDLSHGKRKDLEAFLGAL